MLCRYAPHLPNPTKNKMSEHSVYTEQLKVIARLQLKEKRDRYIYLLNIKFKL